MKFLILSLRGIIGTTCLSGLIIPEERGVFKERGCVGGRKVVLCNRSIARREEMAKLEIIEGIGGVYADKLRAAGIGLKKRGRQGR